MAFDEGRTFFLSLWSPDVDVAWSSRAMQMSSLVDDVNERCGPVVHVLDFIVQRCTEIVGDKR